MKKRSVGCFPCARMAAERARRCGPILSKTHRFARYASTSWTRPPSQLAYPSRLNSARTRVRVPLGGTAFPVAHVATAIEDEDVAAAFGGRNWLLSLFTSLPSDGRNAEVAITAASHAMTISQRKRTTTWPSVRNTTFNDKAPLEPGDRSLPTFAGPEWSGSYRCAHRRDVCRLSVQRDRVGQD
jgi:hypothetical protein